MALLSRSSTEAAADLIVMGLAGAIILLSALAVVAVLPLLLLVTAIGANGWLGGWWTGLWFPAAFLAAIYNVIAGLQALNDPGPAAAGKLLAVSVFIVMACPLLWLP